MTGGQPPRGGPRECKRCGELFQRKCGNQRFCELCRRSARREYVHQYRKIYYTLNIEKLKASSRLWESRNPERCRRFKREHAARKARIVKTQVIGFYSNGAFACVCCGQSERDFLTLDHIDGDGNKITREQGIPRAGTSLYMWLFRNGFPKGYQIVCVNCNMSKAKHGRCVHQMSTGLAIANQQVRTTFA